MLNDDGAMLPVKEIYQPTPKWSELSEKNVSTKIAFWREVARTANCPLARVKSLVRMPTHFNRHFIANKCH